MGIDKTVENEADKQNEREIGKMKERYMLIVRNEFQGVL